MAWPAGIEPLLARLNAWITRRAGEILGWTLGVAGFLPARDAAVRLNLLDALIDR